MGHLKKSPVASRIKKLRLEHNLSQRRLTVILDLSWGQISRFESGTIIPNLECQYKICDYFNVTLDYLNSRTNLKNPTFSDLTKENRLKVIAYIDELLANQRSET